MLPPLGASTSVRRFGLATLTASSALACDQKAPEPAAARPTATLAAPSAPPTPVTLSAQLARPAPERLVAFGDVHGDIEAARRVLRLAGAIDERDRWAGGKLVVVQTGDLIDRGDGDRAVLDLVDRLVGEAKAAGGEFISVLGNHELMNVALDFRYVTPGGFSAFADATPGASSARAAATAAPSAGRATAAPSAGRAAPASSAEAERGRAAAFRPGGPYALRFGDKPLFVKVGDSVFVHGGVLPKHVSYGLDRMNDEVHAWVLGRRPEPPGIVTAEDGPIWTRAYSNPGRAEACSQLSEALARLGAKRMVVGHTVQQDGINAACDGRVWRIDVGLSRYYGGPTQALEIGPEGPKVLRQDK
ncbi:MAG TPA: metallophosphoesterase [Polyangiaceae bacterium]|nr:metallophosphoesterase [Polyangiaceae bacterium]